MVVAPWTEASRGTGSRQALPNRRCCSICIAQSRSGQSTVVIVEGFFDCLKVFQAGFASVVALMGSALYEPQRRLLMQNFRQIVLMLDGDAPGRRVAAIISERLSEDCSVRIVQLGEDIQPDRLSEPVLRELLAREGGQPEIH